jgi:hypothetical protein
VVNNRFIVPERPVGILVFPIGHQTPLGKSFFQLAYYGLGFDLIRIRERDVEDHRGQIFFCRGAHLNQDIAAHVVYDVFEGPASALLFVQIEFRIRNYGCETGPAQHHILNLQDALGGAFPKRLRSRRSYRIGLRRDAYGCRRHIIPRYRKAQSASQNYSEYGGGGHQLYPVGSSRDLHPDGSSKNIREDTPAGLDVVQKRGELIGELLTPGSRIQ